MFYAGFKFLNSLTEVTDHRDKTFMPYFHTAIVLLKLYNPNSRSEANFSIGP